jgi:hypothetical protein
VWSDYASIISARITKKLATIFVFKLDQPWYALTRTVSTRSCGFVVGSFTYLGANMGSSSVVVLLPAPKRRLSHGKPPVKISLQRTELPGTASSISASSQTSDEELDSDGDSISDYDNSSESDASEQNELPVPSSSATKTSARPSRRTTAERATSLKMKPRPYACTHSGCEKSYRKPSRLQEHERSHTGEANH